jgi:hypothetical protein
VVDDVLSKHWRKVMGYYVRPMPNKKKEPKWKIQFVSYDVGRNILTECLICETLFVEILMNVIVLDTCEKELKKLPVNVLEDFVDAVAKLSIGLKLGMPLSRKMEGMGKSVH